MNLNEVTNTLTTAIIEDDKSKEITVTVDWLLKLIDYVIKSSIEVALLKQALDMLKQFASELGGCDHDVNICQCGLNNFIEHIEETLSK